MVMFNSYVSLPEGRLSTVMLDLPEGTPKHPFIFLIRGWQLWPPESPVEVELLLYMGLLGN